MRNQLTIIVIKIWNANNNDNNNPILGYNHTVYYTNRLESDGTARGCTADRLSHYENPKYLRYLLHVVQQNVNETMQP